MIDSAIRSLAVYTGGEIIGDGLWKLGFIRALRATLPEARLTWIARAKSVFNGPLKDLTTPYLDEVIDETRLAVSIRDLIGPRPPFGPYDVVLDTTRTFWRTLHLRRIPHGRFISATSRYRLSDLKPASGADLPRHLVELWLTWLTWLGLEVQRPAGAIVLPPDLLEKAAAALPVGQTYVGFVPGAGDRTKCWPLERFIALARAQAEAGAVPVFFLGPQEMDWRAEIEAAVPLVRFPEQDEALWGGGFDVKRVMALGTRLQAAISNDCGTGHMLAAADTPMLSLFGPTEAAKFRPMITRGAVLEARSFSGGAAMDAIPLEAATNALNGLMRGSRT